MKEVIIDRPSLQSMRQRFIYGSVTLVFWALWIYLWLPILAFIGWTLGIRIAYEEMVVRHGFAVLRAMLVIYTTVVAYLGGSLLVWAYYNFFRFRRAHRRRARFPVTRADQGEYYGIDPQVLATWAKARRIVLRHDSAGRIVSADP